MPQGWNKTHISYSGTAAVETLVAPSPPGPLGATQPGLMLLHAINVNQITPGTGAVIAIDVYDYNNPTGTGVGPAGALISHIVPTSSPIVPLTIEYDAVMTVGIEIVVAGGGTGATAIDLTVLWT